MFGKIIFLLNVGLVGIDRYFVWLDSKFCFYVDLFLILECFLWWGDYEYVIFNYYD